MATAVAASVDAVVAVAVMGVAAGSGLVTMDEGFEADDEEEGMGRWIVRSKGLLCSKVIDDTACVLGEGEE